jgi:hypothetical protein
MEQKELKRNGKQTKYMVYAWTHSNNPKGEGVLSMKCQKSAN